MASLRGSAVALGLRPSELLRLAPARVSVHLHVRGSVNMSVCAPWGEVSGLVCSEEQ